MTWQELTKIALLGTENSTFSEQTLQALQAQGIDVSKEAPLVLAEGAALFSQLRKAGFRLENFNGELPKAAENSGEKICSIRSAHHLHLILNGPYGPILPEFFEVLIKNKKCLPPEHLPILLKRPDKSKWIDFLEASLSTGGRWLLAQHPEWRILSEKPSADWHTGSREERLLLLAYLRRHDPSAGLELVQSTWSEEQPADKKAFLLLLQVGLSMADEPFLEHCLDDNRKEVRLTAAQALLHLPESRLAERMFQRTVQCFDWNGRKIQINSPATLDAEAERDGILKMDTQWKGGVKASYLGQVLSAVPPQQWEVFFKKTPADVVQLFAGTDWPDTLLLACAIATVRHRDEAWLDALLSYWFLTERQQLWETDAVTHPLLKAAPAATANRLAIQFLDRQHSLPGENSPLFQLLKTNEHPWNDRLTMMIIKLLQEWLNKASLTDWQSFHNKEYLKILAFRCNPDLFDDLQKGWNSAAPQWAFWEKSLEEMLSTVLFRREMRAELEVP